MKKHSVKIDGHATSISLEDEFWQELKMLARQRDQSISTLISEIDRKRTSDNLSSALRIYVLQALQQRN